MPTRRITNPAYVSYNPESVGLRPVQTYEPLSNPVSLSLISQTRWVSAGLMV